MVARLGVKGEDPSHRDALTREHKEARALCRSIFTALKAARPSQETKKLSSQFEATLKVFESVSQQIEQKQKTLVRRSIESNEDKEEKTAVTSQLSHNSSILENDIQFLPYTINEIEQRRKELLELESDVREISEMFKDLSVLVNQQQQGIDVIQANTESARVHTEQGHAELMQAEVLQGRARRKQCFLLLLLVVVLCVIIVPTSVVLKS